MKLWVMRHGDAGPEKSDPEAERDRGLTDLGEEMVVAAGRALKKRAVLPKVVLASNYARTAETADVVGKILGVHVSHVDELSPHVPARGLVEALLADAGSKRVLLVGHHDNLVPAFSELGGEMGDLVREDDDYERGDFPMLAKAEVRRLSIDRGSGAWECVDRVCPDDLGFPRMMD